MANTYDAQKDPYAQRSVPINSYARLCEPVTPGTPNSKYFKALFVGTGGDIEILPINATDDANTVTFTNVPNGTLLPVQGRLVVSVTDADDIIALMD